MRQQRDCFVCFRPFPSYRCTVRRRTVPYDCFLRISVFCCSRVSGYWTLQKEKEDADELTELDHDKVLLALALVTGDLLREHFVRWKAMHPGLLTLTQCPQICAARAIFLATRTPCAYCRTWTTTRRALCCELKRPVNEL